MLKPQLRTPDSVRNRKKLTTLPFSSKIGDPQHPSIGSSRPLPKYIHSLVTQVWFRLKIVTWNLWLLNSNMNADTILWKGIVHANFIILAYREWIFDAAYFFEEECWCRPEFSRQMFRCGSLGRMKVSIERYRCLQGGHGLYQAVRHLHLGDKLIRGPMENRDSPG